MYLIKLEMALRDARRYLSDCQEMHRFVTKLFGTDRKESQILYRTNLLQNTCCIYLYAQIPAEHIPEYCTVQQRDISDWMNGMEAGQLWGFDLVASPSKKVVTPGQKNSQRRILRQPEERQEWLERKALQNGFSILQITEQGQVHTSGRHREDKGGTMYHDAYHYQGVLQIRDVDAFRKALQVGIGPGKAYGFGMMLVKRT